jgi:amino-acid N-acetyltransferase
VTDSFHIRPARTSDVSAIKKLVAPLADQRILMAKETVAYYESLQEFRIAESSDGDVIGCGALHVMWEDLAEIRTVAVDPGLRGRKIGHKIVAALLDQARELGVRRVFCLTFETRFFGSFGFTEIDGAAVPHGVYEQLLRSSRTRWGTRECCCTYE